MSESGFNWFERLIGSVTFWAIVFNVLVVVVEMVPFFGTILAALLTVTCIAYLLPHLVTVGLIADVAMKRLYWPLLLIPVFLYGAYYVTYFNQQTEVSSYAAKMRAVNPALLLRYDPAVHDLVLDSNEARQLLKSFKVPVTYERALNTPKAFRSMSSGLCDEMKAAGVYKAPLTGDQPRCDFNSYYSRKGPDITASTARTFEWFEKPSRKPVDIFIEDSKISSRDRKASLTLNLIEKTYRVEFEGREAGRYIAASYYPLPLFPAWAYVCFSWEQVNCGGQFYSTLEHLDTYPEKFDRAVYGENIAAGLLGLTPYADKQMSDFKPYPETEAIGRMLIDRKKNEKPEDFNEWGIRKDDARLPAIGERNGIPSYEGGIYVRQLGGSFYRFIKDNEGKTVYIDARLDGNGNPSNHGFGLYGVCGEGEDCSAVDHYYNFTNGGGSTWNREDFRLKGYWQVSTETLIEHSKDDTRTVLQGVEAPQ